MADLTFHSHLLPPRLTGPGFDSNVPGPQGTDTVALTPTAIPFPFPDAHFSTLPGSAGRTGLDPHQGPGRQSVLDSLWLLTIYSRPKASRVKGSHLLFAHCRVSMGFMEPLQPSCDHEESPRECGDTYPGSCRQVAKTTLPPSVESVV